MILGLSKHIDISAIIMWSKAQGGWVKYKAKERFNHLQIQKQCST